MPPLSCLTLAAPGWLIGLLAAGFVLICLFMMLVILIQKPKGGGLSGAFGGAGGGNAQAAFGAKVGDVLTWLTVACFVLFIFLAMGLTWTINPTVAEHQNNAAQPPASETMGEEPADGEQTAEDDAESETDAEAETETADTESTPEAEPETAPDDAQTPAEDDTTPEATDAP